jgi:creatinine amidohydrolase
MPDPSPASAAYGAPDQAAASPSLDAYRAPDQAATPARDHRRGEASTAGDSSRAVNESRQGAQLEFLRPHEIEAALAANSTVYLPLGSIEWHSHHLPVGLDSLTAHGVCLKAASDHGGLVYPPLYFGTGGGHGRYPWTVMMDDDLHIRALLLHALTRLHDFGVKRVVLFSGHFADDQLDMIASLAAEWNGRTTDMTVIARGINMAEGLAIAPDHAGVFETTMLYALWPDRVDLAQMSPHDPTQPFTDDFADTRHDPTHPLWGVFGPDPRTFNPADAPALLAATANWLATQASLR